MVRPSGSGEEPFDLTTDDRPYPDAQHLNKFAEGVSARSSIRASMI
jgi:hypothetical protein